MTKTIGIIALALVVAGCSAKVEIQSKPQATNAPAVSPHQQMSSLVQGYRARGVSNFEGWTAADKARFDALLASETKR